MSVVLQLDVEYSPAMMVRSAFTKWFAIGAVVATILLVGQVQEVGGIAGLLQVAEGGHLQPAITDILGDIPLADEGGHDTSLFYGIGLDPTGEWVPELIDHPAYRYRRILHPVAASAFGLLDGYPLIWGMMVVVTVSTALAAGFVAASSVRMQGSDWVALVVILNPGVWLGVRLLTAEPLALALMAAGLFFALSDAKRASLAAFVASVLSKEVFAMTPVGLGFSRDRRRWVLLSFRLHPFSSGLPSSNSESAMPLMVGAIWRCPSRESHRARRSGAVWMATTSSTSGLRSFLLPPVSSMAPQRDRGSARRSCSGRSWRFFPHTSCGTWGTTRHELFPRLQC